VQQPRFADLEPVSFLKISSKAKSQGGALEGKALEDLAN